METLGRFLHPGRLGARVIASGCGKCAPTLSLVHHTCPLTSHVSEVPVQIPLLILELIPPHVYEQARALEAVSCPSQSVGRCNNRLELPTTVSAAAAPPPLAVLLPPGQQQQRTQTQEVSVLFFFPLHAVLGCTWFLGVCVGPQDSGGGGGQQCTR